jgi:hypothetical protein
MSSAERPDVTTNTRPPPRLSAGPASRGLRAAPGSWLSVDTQGPLPLAGQPGHGRTATLREQSAWVVYDRQGHRTGLFEIICGDCGDHPYVDYEGIPPRLQRIRGPYSLEAGLAAYAEHVGLPEATPRRAAPGETTMSPGPGGPHIATRPGPATRPRPATRPGPAPAPRDRDDAGDSSLPAAAGSVATLPPPGQPGHGRAARLRRQPFRLVDGRVEGGYTDAFEVICPSCGDHPDLDHSEVPPWLQHLRGPHPLKQGLAVYLEHTGG